jgi:DNA-binding transcriptional MerR regulator
LNRIKRQISEKELENQRLKKQLRELEISVQERRAIYEIQAVRQTEDAGSQKKMAKVLERRKIIDIIKMQEEELARLENELKILQEKNFPNFDALRPPHVVKHKSILS